MARAGVRVDVVTGATTHYAAAADLDVPPLEPPEEGHEPLLTEITTLANTTFAEFAWHVRRGYPVVVSDMAKGWPMLGWSCEDFSAGFPTGEMKAEYASAVGADPRISVGDTAWHE